MAVWANALISYFNVLMILSIACKIIQIPLKWLTVHTDPDHKGMDNASIILKVSSVDNILSESTAQDNGSSKLIVCALHCNCKPIVYQCVQLN